MLVRLDLKIRCQLKKTVKKIDKLSVTNNEKRTKSKEILKAVSVTTMRK